MSFKTHLLATTRDEMVFPLNHDSATIMSKYRRVGDFHSADKMLAATIQTRNHHDSECLNLVECALFYVKMTAEATVNDSIFDCQSSSL